MHAIHCHFCGGVISDPATIEFRPPNAITQLAESQPDPCRCSRPIVYEDSPISEPPTDEASGS